MTCTKITAFPFSDTVVSLEETRALLEGRVVHIAFWHKTVRLIEHHKMAAHNVAIQRATAARNRNAYFEAQEWDRIAKLVLLILAQGIKEGGFR